MAGGKANLTNRNLTTWKIITVMMVEEKKKGEGGGKLIIWGRVDVDPLIKDTLSC